MKWQAEKRARDAEILRQRQIAEQKEAEEREREELARKQEKAKREKAREQERMQREQKETAQRKTQEVEQRVAAEKAAVIETGREKFAKVMDGFSDVIILPWRSLDKKKRPGAVDAMFYCLTPGTDGRTEVYEVASKSDGACETALLSPTGDTKEVDFSDLVEKMNKSGGLLRDDGFVYLFCPRERAESCPIPYGAVDPAELRMGTELYRILYARNKMSKERLTFETWLNVPGGKKPLLVRAVAFGESIRSDEISDMLMDVARTFVPKSSKKPRKRTVVMYDGATIKRQLGVTLVPRSPRKYDSNYASLAAEARRQEREEQERLDAERRKEQEAVGKKFQALRESATLKITLKAVDARNVSNAQ